MLVFNERGKPEYLEKNLSEQSREPTNSTHLLWYRVRESIPGPHWWEVGALITTPILFPPICTIITTVITENLL